jgi:hypothetical protein
VNGDPYGGFAELDRALLWRPSPHRPPRNPDRSSPGHWRLDAPGIGSRRRLRISRRDRANQAQEVATLKALGS